MEIGNRQEFILGRGQPVPAGPHTVGRTRPHEPYLVSQPCSSGRDVVPARPCNICGRQRIGAKVAARQGGNAQRLDLAVFIRALALLLTSRDWSAATTTRLSALSSFSSSLSKPASTEGPPRRLSRLNLPQSRRCICQRRMRNTCSGPLRPSAGKRTSTRKPRSNGRRGMRRTNPRQRLRPSRFVSVTAAPL